MIQKKMYNTKEIFTVYKTFTNNFFLNLQTQYCTVKLNINDKQSIVDLDLCIQA